MNKHNKGKKHTYTPPEHKTKRIVSTHNTTHVALAFQTQWAVDIASALVLLKLAG